MTENKRNEEKKHIKITNIHTLNAICNTLRDYVDYDDDDDKREKKTWHAQQVCVDDDFFSFFL